MGLGGDWRRRPSRGIWVENPMKNKRLWPNGKACAKCGDRFVATARKSYCDVACLITHRYTQNEAGCWVFAGALNSSGYPSVGVGDKIVGGHRLAFETAYGPVPPGMCVCHRCDNRACVNPDHLFLGSNAENMADMRAKRRQAGWSKKSSRKLTPEQVNEIRAVGRGNLNELAERFGVSTQTVWAIQAGRKWTSLEGAL